MYRAANASPPLTRPFAPGGAGVILSLAPSSVILRYAPIISHFSVDCAVTGTDRALPRFCRTMPSGAGSE